MSQEDENLEMIKWARFLYELWQKEKTKKMKDNEINEQKTKDNR